MSEDDIKNLNEMLVDFNEYSTDYTKSRCRELEKTIENTLEEIERLNNIINELEKYLKEYSNDLEFRCYANMFLDKLQELKGSDKE